LLKMPVNKRSSFFMFRFALSVFSGQKTFPSQLVGMHLYEFLGPYSILLLPFHSKKKQGGI